MKNSTEIGLIDGNEEIGKLFVDRSDREIPQVHLVTTGFWVQLGLDVAGVVDEGAQVVSRG